MEEAATPLPSEETTPPVTNIYFGAIRVVRAATTPALDCSYLSGLPSTAGHRFQVCSTNLSTMTTYAQLWARGGILSIPTVCVDKCKIFIHAETFSRQKGSNLRGSFPVRTLTLPAQLPSSRKRRQHQCHLTGQVLQDSIFRFVVPGPLSGAGLASGFCTPTLFLTTAPSRGPRLG